MRLNLYEDKKINGSEEHVDLYYSNMRPVIKQIIDAVNSERPSLSGRPADEDIDDGIDIIRPDAIAANNTNFPEIKKVCLKLFLFLLLVLKIINLPVSASQPQTIAPIILITAR